jgi:hypothetical protein
LRESGVFFIGWFRAFVAEVARLPSFKPTSRRRRKSCDFRYKNSHVQEVARRVTLFGMGQILPPQPVLLLLAAFSRYGEALDWARSTAEAEWGPVALTSEPFAFVDTDYYEATMGPRLAKQFFAFERLVDPGLTPSIKRITNGWEEEYAALASSTNIAGEPRPLNLDPGYITLAKLVLASTKDHAHRIYLADGIFAEVTLSYKHRGWRAHEWTFPDYQRAEYHEFFTRCREWLKERGAGRGARG